LLHIFFNTGVISMVYIRVFLLEKILLYFFFVLHQHVIDLGVVRAEQLAPFLAVFAAAGGIPAEVVVLDEDFGMLIGRWLTCVYVTVALQRTE